MPIAGGTDVMVEINLDHHRPAAIIDLTRIRELDEWAAEGELLRIGAGVTYARIIGELGARLPGLRWLPALSVHRRSESRHRRRNLGSASPAATRTPCLLATDAMSRWRRRRGSAICPCVVLHRFRSETP